jgi:wyosine [tRNA(Phe)-imidazoG37] synthetase (radical SAM superfamily)
MGKKFKYIFGPVPSRRLGLSLGVDIIPYKTCPFDCVYCESGKTTDLTVKRDKYIAAEFVVEELADYLSALPELDYITFSGAGEPVLNSDIGVIIGFIKKKYPQYKVSVLTNSSLFFDKKAIHDVREADLLVASLDAVSDDIIKKINRPHAGLVQYDIVEGLVELRRHFNGELWLEIFVVPGINDTTSELLKIKKAIDRILPDKVQVNCLDRPGTEDWVKQLTEMDLTEIKKILDGSEAIVNSHSAGNLRNKKSYHCEAIIEMIRRRPCTVADIKKSFNMDISFIEQCLENYIKNGLVYVEKKQRGLFYGAKL